VSGPAGLFAGSLLSELKGIGPKRTVELEEQGLRTVEDLLFLFPFRYEDRSRFGAIADLAAGDGPATLSVVVKSSRVIHTRRRNFRIVQAVVQDDSGEIKVVWYNQPYLKPRLEPDRELVLFGRPVEDKRGELILQNPEPEFQETGVDESIHTGRIVPVYRKVAGLSCRMLRKLMYQALQNVDAAALQSRLPEKMQSCYGTVCRNDALRAIHFPEQGTCLQKLEDRDTEPWRALAFEEMFLLQLGLAVRKERTRQEGARAAILTPDACRVDPASVLPFELTEAQRKVLGEIQHDLESAYPMRRLLQGDVGSGKTAVALLAMLQVAAAGRQAVLMAPTGILAAQHKDTFGRLLHGSRFQKQVGVLTGDLKGQERKKALAAIAGGEWKLILGTHALFQDKVRFLDPGLIVVDEQHRFGVLQRVALADKGRAPDLLVMTATPIPRTLAMTVYGDLDLSVLDELPPGRVPVDTRVRTDREREKVYRGMSEAVRRGRQVFVVVPLVEGSQDQKWKDASSHAGVLAERFPDFVIGLVHGRMAQEEKDRVMTSFRRGAIDILVATTVIEVGVDVPNATVMVVEDAGRFGLAQLHQLRGRVGRGGSKSWCILIGPEKGSNLETMARLDLVASTSDGFEIAERDLEMRGPGALMGVEQHGDGEFWFVRLAMRSPELLESAREEARRLVADGRGRFEEAELILQQVPSWWRQRLRLAEAG
jgi:ATP-dependent DNA helicase RecG